MCAAGVRSVPTSCDRRVRLGSEGRCRTAGSTCRLPHRLRHQQGGREDCWHGHPAICLTSATCRSGRRRRSRGYHHLSALMQRWSVSATHWTSTAGCRPGCRSPGSTGCRWVCRLWVQFPAQSTYIYIYIYIYNTKVMLDGRHFKVRLSLFQDKVTGVWSQTMVLAAGFLNEAAILTDNGKHDHLSAYCQYTALI